MEKVQAATVETTPPIIGSGEVVMTLAHKGCIYVEFADDETGELETLALVGGKWWEMNYGNA